jgi:hypothetical protein
MSKIPVKNQDVVEQRQASGDVLLVYPVVMRPWIAKLLKRFQKVDTPPQVRKVQLDTLGTSVWDAIDGKRSVRGLIKAFVATHRVHRKEGEVAVTAFIRDLGKRGLIGLR